MAQTQTLENNVIDDQKSPASLWALNSSSAIEWCLGAALRKEKPLYLKTKHVYKLVITLYIYIYILHTPNHQNEHNITRFYFILNVFFVNVLTIFSNLSRQEGRTLCLSVR